MRHKKSLVMDKRVCGRAKRVDTFENPFKCICLTEILKGKRVNAFGV